jgi:hypothetical protein
MDPRYSADARWMRARADNMKITITMLEAERSHKVTSMERRAITRTKVDATACILPAEHNELLRCDVVDLTGNGARIELGRLASRLSAPFEFSFDNFRTIRRARLAWARDSFAGVAFL